jgi:hypothetical protein
MIFAFRPPRFPVLLDSGSELIAARTDQHLRAVIKSLNIQDKTERLIIDINADQFHYHPGLDAVSPCLIVGKMTKRSIIDLYNARRGAQSQPLRATSLGSRTLERVVLEAIELVEASMNRAHQP